MRLKVENQVRRNKDALLLMRKRGKEQTERINDLEERMSILERQAWKGKEVKP